MRWRILAVVLVAVTAGCGSVVGLGGSSTSETVTPAPVPTVEPTTEESRMGIAPGLSPSGVFDRQFLIENHVGAVSGSSYVMEEQTRQVHYRRDNSLTTSNSQRIVVENASVYYRTVSSMERYIDGQRHFIQGYEEYSNGSVQYTTWHETDRVDRVYRRVADPPGADRHSRRLNATIDQYLNLDNQTVTRADVGERPHYEIRGTRSTVLQYGDVENYTTHAIVREDGLIKQLDTTFETVRNDTPVRIHYSARYSKLGRATVVPPEWLSTARERTGAG